MIRKLLSCLLLLLGGCLGASCDNEHLYDASHLPTLRVLCIGSSLSEDAVEQYLHEVGVAAGYNIIVGNLYHGGCSTNMHWQYARDNEAAYDFRYIGSNGKRHIIKDYTVERALGVEQWDYISMQQAGEQSGLYPTHPERFRPALDSLMAYVGRRAPQARLLWHQTWAYDTWTTDAALEAYYESSQQLWFERIQATSRALKEELGFSAVVPAGTAIQRLRETGAVGDNITRDGAHLNYTWGRYTASLTWLYQLTGQSPVGLDYGPKALSSEQRRICQEAAAKAVEE